jgi:three-Cys-motif partner protein
VARYWGFWTRGKLELLRRYLDAFTTTTKNKATERIYLDIFGGQPENRDRLTNDLLDGSARIALSIDDPPFTRLRFLEVEPYATRLRSALEEDFPGRDFRVVAGDCNTTIHATLQELAHLNWAPTFAFVDPNGPDTHWSTIEALAAFKRKDRPRAEIWLLLAAGMFMRNLRTDGSVRHEDSEQLTKMYGTEQWKVIYAARVAGDLTPAEARDEYVNLMRWRLERELGYKWTHPLEVFNEQGLSIYHMIFATDHPLGTKIMTSLYSAALSEFPAMRQAARQQRARLEEEAAGISTLFGEEFDELAAPLRRGERFYEYTPPTPPYGTATSTEA